MAMRLIFAGIVLWFSATAFLILLFGAVLWLLRRFSSLKRIESADWARWTAYGLLVPPGLGFAFAVAGVVSAVLCLAVSNSNCHYCMHRSKHLCCHSTTSAVRNSHMLLWVTVAWLGLTGSTGLLALRRSRLTNYSQPSPKLRRAIVLARLPSRISVWETESDAPAGLVGVISPSIFVSRKLVLNLSVHELAAVLKHEYAHFLRRDHWFRLLFFVTALLFAPVPFAIWLQREWRCACEKAADDFAAVDEKSAKCLSIALQTVQGFGSVKSDDEILHRIKRLGTKRRSGSFKNWGFAGAMALSLVSASIFFLVQPLWLTFHCFAEALMLR